MRKVMLATVPIILAIVSAAGAGVFDPAACAKAIAPFIDEQTLVIIRIDAARIAPAAIAKQVLAYAEAAGLARKDQASTTGLNLQDGSSGRVFSKADHHINAFDAHAVGHHRRIGQLDITSRNVLKLAAFFKEKVAVFSGGGIEIRARRVNHDFLQQPGLGELVERVVHGRP